MARKLDKNDFEARLERIRTGKRLALVSPEEAAAVGAVPLSSMKRRKARGQPRGLSKLVKIALAFGVGFGSMLVGRVLAFRYTGAEVAQDDYLGQAVMFGGDLGIAIGLSILLMLLLRLNRKPFLQAELAGFLMLMFAEGMVAQQVPDIWSVLFSPEYTAQVLEDQAQIGAAFEAISAG